MDSFHFPYTKAYLQYNSAFFNKITMPKNWHRYLVISESFVLLKSKKLQVKISTIERNKMKYKLYIKNIIQIIISIFMGWISFWWLGFAYIEITEVDDLDSLWLRPYAMTMFIVGIGIVISKEIIMFRKNRSLKKYLLFSFLPFIITFIALYLYLSYF